MEKGTLEDLLAMPNSVRDLGTLPEITISVGKSDARKRGYVAPDIKAEQRENMRKAAKEDGGTSLWQSALLGASDLGAGVLQGAHYVGDGIAGAINKTFGTDLDTTDYEQFTKERAGIEKYHEMRRQENGQGFDVGRLGGEIGATLPVAMLGRGFQGAKVLSKAGAKVLGQNAGLGAAIGGTGFATDSGDRAGSATSGAIGGAVGAAAGEKIGTLLSNVYRKIKPSAVTSADVESVIEIALSQSNNAAADSVKFADLSQSAKDHLAKEVEKLLRGGQTPDAQTLQRMAVFSNLKAQGVDFQPTIKQASGEGGVWTRETELSKLAGGKALNEHYVQQNNSLVGALDDMQTRTGGTSIDALQTGQNIIKTLEDNDVARNNYIGAMYDQAKSHTGNDLTLDAGRLLNKIQFRMNEDLIDSELVPKTLLNRIEEYSKGTKPFTLSEKEMLVKAINRRVAGADNQTRFALGAIRDELEKEVDDVLSAHGGALQGQAKVLWDDARAAARGRFELIDQNPALKKVLSGVEPDQFFDKFIVKGNIREVQSLADEIRHNPEAFNGVRQEIIRKISEKSVNENNAFSPAGMSNVLKAIGDRRLGIFFKPEEVKHLKDLHSAGRFMFSRPVGSNVNHSNPASALMNYMNVFSNIPIIKGAVDKYVAGTGRGINAHIKIGQGAKALSKTAGTKAPTAAEKEIIDKWIKAGFITGTTAD